VKLGVSLMRKTHTFRALAALCTIHKLSDLRKVPKAEMSDFLVDKYEWLAALHDGVGMVRLEKHAVVIYCIVINAKNKLILDSAENYPVRLLTATISI